MTTTPKAPPGLKTAGRRFWRHLHQTYEFDGCPEVLMLAEEAARTADLVARLQETVDQAVTLRTNGSRGQLVAIPELTELRQYRAQFASLVKQLDLPAPEPDEDEEPTTQRHRPMSRSESGRVAAKARWAARTGVQA